MQSDIAKYNNITKSDLGIRCPKSQNFAPANDDSPHPIFKSYDGISPSSSRNAQQKYEVHTVARVAINVKITNTTAMRNAVAPPPRAHYPLVGRRGLGPRDQDEQRIKRAFLVATYRTRQHTEAKSSHHGACFVCLVDNSITWCCEKRIDTFLCS